MGLRKNQNSLSQAEKDRYVQAVLRMKTDTGAPYNYDQFVSLHATIAASTNPDANPAHRGPAFCPWHRYLLAKFEEALQAADRARGGDGSLTLPYWDWTHDNATSPARQRGEIWDDGFMGGGGAPVSGPFRGWTMVRTDPLDPTVLTRNFGAASIAQSLPRDTTVQLALDCEGFDSLPFDESPDTSAGHPSPPAPTAVGAAGGSLAPGTYSVTVTYVNAPAVGREGETRPSPPAMVCLGGGCAPANTNQTITVSSPPARSGATGYRAYVSTANGAPATQTRQGGTTAFGTPVTVSTLAAGIARPTVNTTGSFRNILEGFNSARGEVIENHNRVHVWVGGSMGPVTSPNDPVFFLHHCNVDRIWALWQFRHPGQNYPEVVPNVTPPGNRPEGLNEAMPPWTSPPELVRPVDVLNHTSITIGGRSLGYTYDTDPRGVSVDVNP